MTPEQQSAVEAWLKDADDMLDGTGAHEGHTLSQVGRCIYCSCGKRVQGKLPKGEKSL